MPIYEYTCQECQQRFDARRAMRDADAPIACPQCGGMQTRHGLSLFAAHCDSTRASSGGSAGCGSCRGGNCGSCSH
ncbi:MAG TPA: zinc ribbon domain-containing protein [Chloroflexi bacterium]|nr:zinc ribbon domain-containing protein [Chloroflexota bacterium]